jgi:hypothetical protein
LSHWHCILPVAAIGIAMFFMREKPASLDDRGKHTSDYDIEIR